MEAAASPPRQARRRNKARVSENSGTLPFAIVLTSSEELAWVLDADAPLPITPRFPHGRRVLFNVPEQFIKVLRS